MSTINDLAQKFNIELDVVHRDYLTHRGINEQTIKDNLIGLGSVYGKTRITIPIFDADKNVLFFKCRRSPLESAPDVVKYLYFHPDSSGEKSAALYGIELLENAKSEEVIIITEGELDALILRQNGFIAVTSTGGCGTFQEDWIPLFKRFSNIYICYDNDAPGRDGALKVAKKLKHSSLKIITIPNEEDVKDISEYFIKYPTADFTTLLNDARQYDTNTLEFAEFEITDGRVEFIPAQYFTDTTSFITLMLHTKEKDELFSGLYVVNSDHKIVELEEFVKLNNLYIARKLDMDCRWSKDSVTSYLCNKNPSLSFIEVYDKTLNVLRYYIDLNSEPLYKVTALWLLGTYFYRMFKAYPYYNIVGLMSSGKSKLLELCSLIAFNGELLMGSTPAFIIRSIHDNCSTIFLDEAEKLKDTTSPESQTLILMLNSGYKSGVRIGKMNASDKSKGWNQVRYDPYSPKMIAGINNISDTLISRSINVTLLASDNTVIKNREIVEEADVFKEIKDGMYFAVMNQFKLVREAYNTISEDSISGRNWEVWKPILSVACALDELRGDSVPTLYQEILDYAKSKVKLTAQISEESQTALQLLLALKQMMESDSIDEGFFPIENIKEYLITSHSDEFGWLKESSGGKYLGPALRKTGVIESGSRVKWFDTKAMRGYDLNLQVICQRLKALGVTI